MQYRVFLFVAGWLTIASSWLGAGEPRDLVIVAGQSNAVGYDAVPSELPADDSDKDVLFWWRCGDPPPDEHDSLGPRQWTHLRPQPRGKPLARDSGQAGEATFGLRRQYGNFKESTGGFGPEIGLARELRARERKPLAILKVAFSGTGMRTDWNPADEGDGGACYRALVSEARTALAAAKAAEIDCRVRALVWVQGESDANPTDASNYEQALTAMLAALRRDLEAPELIALLAVNTRFGNGMNPHVAHVVKAQQAIAAKDNRCVYVETAEAETLPPSHTHFTAKGTLEVGRLFATSLLKLETAAVDSVLSRFAFGSCAKQDRPQPIWGAVVETRPQFFTFLGDNIYGDTADMYVLRAKYQLLGNQPGFQKLKATCPVLATWDDHDYGQNDGGAEYVSKRESQQVFLDFFGAPADDIRRTREGVYSSQVFGSEGRRVQLILLDARYFRSPLQTGYQPGEPGDGYRGKYAPNTDADATVLGEAQWRWLEEQLQAPAELRFIGSGVQVIPDEHGSEMWGNFPREREKLFALIRQTQAKGVVFLSGDRHLAEISRLPADHPLGVGYPLFDVTSSSLNTPSGNFTKAGTRFANEINSYRVGLTYFDTNFGTVQIDWDQPDPLVRLQVRDEAGAVVLQQRLQLSELR